jgi:hypothetical protein
VAVQSEGPLEMVGKNAGPTPKGGMWSMPVVEVH